MQSVARLSYIVRPGGERRVPEGSMSDLYDTDVVIWSVRQAALLHDLGRCGVPNSIWDKAAAQ